MSEQPCQLWPNHPWPVWLQMPLVIFGLMTLGGFFGWTFGVMWTHFWHYKVKVWLDNKAR